MNVKQSMQHVVERLLSSAPLVELGERAAALERGSAFTLNGAAGSLLAVAAVKTFTETRRQLVLVAADDDRAEKLRDDCILLLGEAQVRYFGARPSHKAQTLDMSASIAQIETMKALAAGATILVVASPHAVAERLPAPAGFSSAIIELKSGGEHDFQKLIEQLGEMGFEKKDFVEGYGDFAVRGGIMDIFPYVGENPVRVEFWGNTIESIREFDVLSQRSIRMLETASVVPDISAPESAEEPAEEGISPAPAPYTHSLFEYLAPDALFVLDEQASIEREITDLHKEGEESLFTWEEVDEKLRPFVRILHSAFHSAQTPGALDLEAAPAPAFGGSVNVLIDRIAGLSLQGYRVSLACDTPEEARRLADLIDDIVTSPAGRPADGESVPNGVAAEPTDADVADAVKDVAPSVLNYEIIAQTVHSGFIYPPAKIALFTEHEVFGRLKRRGAGKRRRFRGISQKELLQLRTGDYVVHIDHGIGVFDGLTKITVGGAEQEVMRLLFLEEDILYVNLNFVNRVQKYSSQEGHTPRLTKLGAPDWERMKAKAKRRIKDIARELIALYARRKLEAGHAFPPDTHWQKEMEASFMFEDTPDQTHSTADVKRDMESPSPMDRLICGDVGFGKTEVAVRAAFKAVAGGTQVAVLVPTTILALQHFHTFSDRLQRYAVRVEHITRFRSPKEQKQIVEGAKGGTVDILIGTHRLLSKDIGFRNLGLLIIDEEHRFGVTAKEKLRQLKATVDTLTLTATPIPRTLHFSLIGARDLSLINTPPRNRLPIVTEIVPGDTKGRQTQWRVAREAIVHELHRNGQVYFVHDRVSDIDLVADRVRTLVPEARVHVAHGQMAGHELEKTMLEFQEKKYDVLVCTKIIESGLDIPNANTIIINRADRFGLAELYQLRGRVGRSNVQAYGYLLTPPLSSIPRPTLRRLQAIEEFAELGSGFNLAMRDLEIRGTGNLLGAEQSGFILDMGFEMYERIVRESVEELKQEEFGEVFTEAQKQAAAAAAGIQTVVDADIEMLIPDLYIRSDAERLDVYRRLYRAASHEEIQALREELRDRFGEYPEEVENLFSVAALRLTASRAGFSRITLRATTLTITLPDETNAAFYGADGDTNSPFQRLAVRIQKEGKRAQMKQEGKALTVRVTLTKAETAGKRVESARGWVEGGVEAA